MARLGLKILFLRTRIRGVSQQQMADDLGIRQASLSNIERGTSMPTSPLLLELCRYFDVSPTYLLDDERGVVPLPTDRWSLRNHLVTAGMWVEVPRASLVDLGNGHVLCPLLPGGAFYDDEARHAREQAAHEAALRDLVESRRSTERTLVYALQGELRAHPRRRRPRA